MAYMKSTHPDAFKGMRLRVRPDHFLTKLTWCPVCGGYGGWHLELNAYGLGRHFDAHCSQCNGWGWVSDEDLCIHEQRLTRNLGRCLNEYKCSKCGNATTLDSSG